MLGRVSPVLAPTELNTHLEAGAGGEPDAHPQRRPAIGRLGAQERHPQGLGLAACQGIATGEPVWDAKVESLPRHTESRLWLVTGLLLPVWDRLPREDLRVRRLRTDEGQTLIGRVLNPEQAIVLRKTFGLRAGPLPSPAEVYEALTGRAVPFSLANGWRLVRRRLMGAHQHLARQPSLRVLSRIRAAGRAATNPHRL